MKKEVLGTGIKKIAAGYLFLHITFSLGVVDLLPDWAGYLLMLQGIGMIGEWRESALLLKSIGRILMGLEVLKWAGSFLGIALEVELLTVFMCMIDLYFHFQLLTEIAEIGRETGPGYWKKICRMRTAKTVLSTAMAVVTLLPVPHIVWNGYHLVRDWLMPGLAVIFLLLALWIFFTLRALASNLLLEGEISNQPENVIS